MRGCLTRLSKVGTRNQPSLWKGRASSVPSKAQPPADPEPSSQLSFPLQLARADSAGAPGRPFPARAGGGRVCGFAAPHLFHSAESVRFGLTSPPGRLFACPARPSLAILNPYPPRGAPMRRFPTALAAGLALFLGGL